MRRSVARPSTRRAGLSDWGDQGEAVAVSEDVMWLREYARLLEEEELRDE